MTERKHRGQRERRRVCVREVERKQVWREEGQEECWKEGKMMGGVRGKRKKEVSERSRRGSKSGEWKVRQYGRGKEASWKGVRGKRRKEV